jgi:group I intron endonuclease
MFIWFVLFYYFLLNVTLCESVEDLPVVIEFTDLHLTEKLVEAIQALNGLAGVYCVKNLVTGSLYLGSSIFLANRLKKHILSCHNPHLFNAMKRYGLKNFSFIIVEYTELDEDIPEEEIKEALLASEQHWLDWLFSLPSHLRYNLSPTASSPLGVIRSAETRALINASQIGHPGFPGNTHACKTVSV